NECVVVLAGSRGNRRSEGDTYPPGSGHPPEPGHDLVHAVEVSRDDGNSCIDGQDGGTLAEGSDCAGRGQPALRKNDYRPVRMHELLQVIEMRPRAAPARNRIRVNGHLRKASLP